jgi:hypothetical protein
MRRFWAKTIVVAVVGCFISYICRSAIAQDRENELEKFKARWQLKFLPEQLPEMEKLINGTMWTTSSSSRNGAGGTQWIVVPAEEKGEARSIQLITRSFNPDKEPRVKWIEESHPLLLVGPFFEYDRKVRTFALDTEKHWLVLDAAVKVSNRGWYHVEVWAVDNDGDGEYVDLIREHLYEFVDNPWLVKRGAVDVRVNFRSSNGLLNRNHQLHGQFERSGQGMPTEQCELTFSAQLPDGSGTRVPTLTLVRGKNYAFVETFEHQWGKGILQKADINRLRDLKKPRSLAGYGSGFGYGQHDATAEPRRESGGNLR